MLGVALASLCMGAFASAGIGFAIGVAVIAGSLWTMCATQREARPGVWFGLGVGALMTLFQIDSVMSGRLAPYAGLLLAMWCIVGGLFCGAMWLIAVGRTIQGFKWLAILCACVLLLMFLSVNVH